MYLYCYRSKAQQHVGDNYVGSLSLGLKEAHDANMVPADIANSNLLRLLSIKRHIQPQALSRSVLSNAALTVCLGNKFLTTSID
jgi:hypothetical protein